LYTRYSKIRQPDGKRLDHWIDRDRVTTEWHWQIAIKSERVVAESPLQDAERLFPPQSLDSLINQIEHPELIPSPTTSPYP
jgi:hypothetical protein